LNKKSEEPSNDLTNKFDPASILTTTTTKALSSSSFLTHLPSSNYAILVVFSVLTSTIILALFLLIMVYCCIKRKSSANTYKPAKTLNLTTSLNDLATSQSQRHHHYNTIVPISSSSSSKVDKSELLLSSSLAANTTTSSTTTTTSLSSSLSPIKEICISLPLAKPYLSELKPQLSVDSAASKIMKAKTLCERRGSNNSLTLNSLKKKVLVISPSKECNTLEYLSKTSRALSISELLGINELIEISKEKTNLINEFYFIPFNHPEVTIAGSSIKNRYKTIVPNESTRVKLPMRNNDLTSTYINANYIYDANLNNEMIQEESFNPTSTSTITTKSLPAYIASQGPMSNTIADFWLMIWTECVPCVVMITKLIESNKSKCELYIPEDLEETHDYGHLVVTLTQINRFQDFEVRQLSVRCQEETRIVYHYWYTAWPDHNVPENPNSLIQLIRQVEAFRSFKSTSNLIGKGPVLVHCSAGIGRTGCFIAISAGIKQIESENLIDVVQIVCRLRKDRGGMVQTLEQYEFIYQVLAYYCIYFKEFPYLSTSSLRSPSVSVSSPSDI
jgi:receptor-type tyrosine-protein phosphatase R